MSRTSRLLNRLFHRDSINPSNPGSAPEDEESGQTEVVDSPVPPSTAANAQDLTPQQSNSLLHWVTYGMASDRGFEPRVGASRWTKEFITPKTVPWNASIRPQDIDKLIRGFQPREMEERWRIYSQDVFDPVRRGRVTGIQVSLHRSWTGHKIFELGVKFSEDLDADGVPTAAWVTGLTYEKDKEAVRSANAGWAQSEAANVCRWVLGVEILAEVSEEVGVI